jgi:hypothetical protein
MSTLLNYLAPPLASPLRLVLALLSFNLVVRAAEQGLPIPASAPISDQKSGSVLFYNFYTSSATSPHLEDTRVSLTNTASTDSVAIHLFFIDGVSCSPADAMICLTPRQTVSFLASEMDPGVRGYIIAVAIDKATGIPINWNHLIGNLSLKMASGHRAYLAAAAISALFGNVDGQLLPGYGAGSVLATLPFDGIHYNQVPAVLAIDHLLSLKDDNRTLLIINRAGGSLQSRADPVGKLCGLLFDDAGGDYPFEEEEFFCQTRRFLSDEFPLTDPVFSEVVPKGRSGWLVFWSADGAGIFGAVLKFNPRPQATSNSGHNLHQLRLMTDALEIPIYPPQC